MMRYRFIPYIAMLVAMPAAAYAQQASNSVLACNGTTDYVVASSALDVTNTFTIELWVNPTTTHQIDQEVATGYQSGVKGEHYAVYPLHGTAIWGAGHAGVGISVGTNGISVYEHAADHMPAVLVYEAPIHGWTHIAVVYQDRRPTLYVNGVLARTGLASTMKYVHPSAGLVSGRYVYGGIGGGPFGYFAGMIDDFRVWSHARSAAEINQTMRSPVPAGTPGLAVVYDMNRNGAGSGLMVRNGSAPTNNAVTVGTQSTPVFVTASVTGDADLQPALK
ncbi:MAG: LamG domain-containing protein [Bacteroidetes bacterium]|nr:LamG domain-containing protein [Bacteroidota bacterium]